MIHSSCTLRSCICRNIITTSTLIVLFVFYTAISGLELQKADSAHEEVPLSGKGEKGDLPKDWVDVLDKGVFGVPNKWIGYGVDPPVETEVKGTVIYIDKNNGFIYLMPDQNYRHLLLPGNTIPLHPRDYKYDWWYNNLVRNYRLLGLPFNGVVPVIKMEPDDQYASLNRNYGHNEGDEMRYRKDDLQKSDEPVQNGDRISVTGLYALELQHTMYGDCKTPFVKHEFNPVCYGHAEIHPYNKNNIKSLQDELKPYDTVNESHTFGFPVYTQVYHTDARNKIMGLWGRMPDDSRYDKIEEEIFIRAPPKPIECGFVDNINCRIVTSENIESGKKTNIVYKKIESDGLRIRVQITDNNLPKLNVSVANPYVLKATWSVYWECFINTPCGKGDPRPQTVAIKEVSKPLLEQSLLPDVPSHCKEFPAGPGCPISRSFTFSSNNNVASSVKFQCSLDGSDFVDCTSPYSRPRTNEGWHILQVRGIDSQGKVNLPASYVTWKTLPPFETIETISPAPECTDIQTDLIEKKKELIRLQDERNSPIKEQADPDPSPTPNDLAAMIADLQTEIKEKEKELQDCIKQHSPTPPANPAPASGPSPSAITNIPGSQSISTEQELYHQFRLNKQLH
jgi:hypothetical protein